ncbi:MAG TPA: DUF2500 family protein [Verrucomicrobiae bacterium]
MIPFSHLIQDFSRQVAEAGTLAQFTPGFSSGPPALFSFFFVIIFVIVVATIVIRIGKGLTEWSDNNQQPVLTVPATVVTKRTNLSVSSNAGSNSNFNHSVSSSTTYYATFQFASGDRREFKLSAAQYGLLAEGDAGELTFQGTRFEQFSRRQMAQRESAPVSSPETEEAQPDSDQSKSAHTFCPYCGVQVNGDFKYCPHCGKTQPVYTT